MQFWTILGQYDPLNSPLYYQRSTFRGSISPNAYINLYSQKIYSFLTFVAWKCTKCTQKSYNWSFWPIFGHLNPQNGRLYYQRSKFKCSYSPKSLHKLALPENVLIFNLYGVKVYQMFLKVVYRVILTNFRTLRPTQKPLILTRKYI